jgi:hypothetical protein
VERLVVVWCPSLLVEGDRGEEARAFDAVLHAVGTLCPWVEPVRLGVCALPARGPSRFFGGEDAVVARLGEVASPVIAEMTTAPPAPAGDEGSGSGALVGVADGLFAATLAARSHAVVPAGGTREFLAPWSVAVLGRPELAVTLQRLGVRTLGQLADLPARHVGERFDADALVCHRVARGDESELPGLRDPGIDRRLAVVRGESPETVRPRQYGFFGGSSEADTAATASVSRVLARLGPAGVLVARLRGGRGPAERGWLLPWGSAEAGAGARAAPLPPWPGCIPPPAPAVVLASPTPAEVADPDARPVQVSGRGLLSGDPALVSVAGGPWEDVAGWAGPWPASERWWGQRRRHARLQVVTVCGASQVARLLVAERGRWWVEAVYD